MKDKLIESCVKNSEKSNPNLDNRPLCECMAEEAMTNKQITDDFRIKLSKNWNEGIKLDGKSPISQEQGAEIGMAFLVWGNCMKKLHPELNIGKPTSNSSAIKVPENIHDRCRLDHLDGVNITRQHFETEKQCIQSLCDIYGPSNAQRGTSSKCVFDGKVIRTYQGIGSTSESEEKASAERKARREKYQKEGMRQNGKSYLESFSQPLSFEGRKAYTEHLIKEYGADFIPTMEEARKLTKDPEIIRFLDQKIAELK